MISVISRLRFVILIAIMVTAQSDNELNSIMPEEENDANRTLFNKPWFLLPGISLPTPATPAPLLDCVNNNPPTPSLMPICRCVHAATGSVNMCIMLQTCYTVAATCGCIENIPNMNTLPCHCGAIPPDFDATNLCQPGRTCDSSGGVVGQARCT